MPETAKRTARVPILGEDGRISDDYIPAAIGEGVESAEAAATRAETAATAAESAKTAAEKARDAAKTAQGGAESAKTAAETAKTAAEKAKADAESAGTAAANSAKKAAGSAQDAQQSATAAQQSAASVADKFITSAQATTLEPGSQATASVENQVLTIGVPKGDKGDKGEKGDTGTGVPEGGAPGQLLSKTDSGTAWVDPPTGNVLTGTLGPAPILSADDAYATKPRRLTVYGNTRQNLWVNPSGTAGGVTVTSNGDGSMTLSGTATSAASVSSADSYIMKPSTAYTLSMNAALTGASFVVTEYDADGSQLAQHNVSSTSAASFTSSASVARCVMSLSVQSGQAISGTYRVMLNEGSEAQPWCPPGLHSVEPTNLVTAGKNLFQYTKQAGIFFTGGLLQVGTYTMSLESLADWWTNNGGNGRYIYYYMYDNLEAAAAAAAAAAADGVMQGYSSTGDINFADADVGVRSSVTFSLRTSGCILFVAYYGATWIDQVTNIQLELGSTATAYEPPNITTTPLPEVELRSLPDGTCDELVIKSDGTATVERRTQLTGDEVTALPEPTTEPQSPVTLPVLPAPTFNQYHDADVPSDTSVEYARDINIVIDNLAKQIAGTAATVAINEATR